MDCELLIDATVMVLRCRLQLVKQKKQSAKKNVAEVEVCYSCLADIFIFR